MDIIPIIIAVALVILAIVLTVVGVQIIMVLYEVKRTLSKVNQTLDNVEERVQYFSRPLQQLGGIASGLKTGMRVFEHFVQFLHKDDDK